MQNDRMITISVGAGRRATVWQAQSLLVSELWEKLRLPTRGSETLAEYLKLNKTQQDDLKDVGGFVGGTLLGSRRKANAVVGRDIITLDLDNIPAGGTHDVQMRVEALGCSYCIYSTRKHHPTRPRLRVLIPLDRTATSEEYEPLARRMGALIGLDLCDPSTFEVGRLMYWPSCSRDSEYIHTFADKPFLSADGLLATYADWRDMTSWPALPGQANFKKLAVKQGTPQEKTGIVGAFCRRYSILRAMEELIPGIYEPVDNSPGRYTYLGGSTTGGAVLYEGDDFLFSHHATDPCGGKLVNAFDLVRLHRFGELDTEAPQETPVNRLPSYAAMTSFALSLPEVAGDLNEARYANAIKDFEGITATPATATATEGSESDTEWMSRLAQTDQGGIKATIDNVRIILEYDPLLKDRFALNEFAGCGEVLGALPWDTRDRRRRWEDNDNQGLYWYMEKVYRITGNGKIDAALSLHSTAHRFNDVQDYLKGLVGKWDGVPRLDTLFSDYLGADDSAYTRTVTRKCFVAAVARAMRPGCKFDVMLVLTGPQGLGKSTLLDKMSGGWFNDSIRTFEGKDASEQIQGVWLVEIAELNAFGKSDVDRIKQFLSLRVDRFRAAYGHHVKEYPRSCVFFGTTNEVAYLRDYTGNRRFWPVDTGAHKQTKNVWRDLDGERDQIWAEAVLRWQSGETLYLDAAMEQIAKERQEAHREVSGREGIVRDFLEREVPDDWKDWTLDKRKMYWAGGMGDIPLVPRDRICAVEVWVEALGGNAKDMKLSEAKEIKAIIASTPGWNPKPRSVRCGIWGQQSGFLREEGGGENVGKGN